MMGSCPCGCRCHVESLNLCLDDRIGLSGMLVYHLLYLLLVFSGITSIFLSKLSLGIKI